jgi:hypothetical protein
LNKYRLRQAATRCRWQTRTINVEHEILAEMYSLFIWYSFSQRDRTAADDVRADLGCYSKEVICFRNLLWKSHSETFVNHTSYERWPRG